MQEQDEFITRNANFEDVAVVVNDKAVLEDILSHSSHHKSHIPTSRFSDSHNIYI